MNATKTNSRKKSLARSAWGSILGPRFMLCLSLGVLAGAFPALAQSQQPPAAPGAQSRPSAPPGTAPSAGQQPSDRQPAGSISGAVVDQTGNAVAVARVSLSRQGPSPVQETQSGENGEFFFANLAPGPFQLTITAEGFATQTVSGTLHSGEAYTVPRIVLAVAPVVTEVRVVPSQTEVAEEQIKVQEKQRVLGFIPNFYVTYIPNAAPLDAKQKFELAWKSTLDPETFGIVGVIAGAQQAQNNFSEYGQGAQGYAKRYGAFYGDVVIGTFIGGAILPSVLKQDPRYFYKGTGSTRSRILYALAASVIAKGDNGRWQANYSNILGNLAASGISNLYYPARDRGVAFTFESALVGIGATAGANLLQEFVIRKLTPKASNHAPAQP